MDDIHISKHATTRFRRRFPDYYVQGVNPGKQLKRLIPLAEECKPYLDDPKWLDTLTKKHGDNIPTYLQYKDMYIIIVDNTVVTVHSIFPLESGVDNSNERHRSLRSMPKTDA